jgi:hypothetical protein
MQTITPATPELLPLELSPETPSSPIVPEIADPAPFYQATGVIVGELERDESGTFSMKWRDKSWPISFMGGNRLGKLKTLVGKRSYWRVYPIPAWTEAGFRVRHFTMVSQPKKTAHLKDGEFKLSGCWQSLPQWTSHPFYQSYFSVYRNREGLMTNRNIYHSNYALNWDEPPFVRIDEQKAPWHSIVALLQEDGVFNFDRVIDGPKPAPPRVRRPKLEPSIKPDRPQLKNSERSDAEIS